MPRPCRPGVSQQAVRQRWIGEHATSVARRCFISLSPVVTIATPRTFRRRSTIAIIHASTATNPQDRSSPSRDAEAATPPHVTARQRIRQSE